MGGLCSGSYFNPHRYRYRSGYGCGCVHAAAIEPEKNNNVSPSQSIARSAQGSPVSTSLSPSLAPSASDTELRMIQKNSRYDAKIRQCEGCDFHRDVSQAGLSKEQS